MFVVLIPIFIYLFRISGEELHLDFRSSAFFFLHTINAYEEENHIVKIPFPLHERKKKYFFKKYQVVDIACYSSPAMLRCMDIRELQRAQSNPDYARLFQGRPRRFVLPLRPPEQHEGQVGEIYLEFYNKKLVK